MFLQIVKTTSIRERKQHPSSKFGENEHVITIIIKSHTKSAEFPTKHTTFGEIMWQLPSILLGKYLLIQIAAGNDRSCLVNPPPPQRTPPLK